MYLPSTLANLLLFLSLTFATPITYPFPPAPAPTTLNLTALTAQNGLSVFECWSLIPSFASSTQKGTTGALSMQLGNLANASYSIIPPAFDAGIHNAPNIQYVVFLSGLAHVTFPSSSDSLYIFGGTATSVLIAADIGTTGHITKYPSSEQTVALQIPTENGVVPGHTVLHAGACHPSEMQV